jgi:pilus assembly protein Flp/PilA
MHIIKFWQAEDGVTAIEYALIGALVAVVIVTGVTLLGTAVESNYDNVAIDVTEVLD